MVGFAFMPPNFGPVLGTYEGFCSSVNVDGVVILLRGGEDTSALHITTEPISIFCTEKW